MLFNMKMQWEVFEGKQYQRTSRNEPRVTLGAKGTFYLNGAAYDELERPPAVEFLYEGNARVIGLRPVDPQKHNAFVIKHHGKGGNYKRISAASFCSHHRLKFKRTLLFENAEVDHEGVMHLDLNKSIEVSRGAR